MEYRYPNETFIISHFLEKGAAVFDFELSLLDGATFDLPEPRETHDTKEMALDSYLERLREAVRSYYSKKPSLATLSLGLCRHSSLLFALCDKYASLPDIGNDVHDMLIAWGSAYLDLLERISELRVLFDDNTAVAWGIEQVRSAARQDKRPPSWKKDSPRFVDGVTELNREQVLLVRGIHRDQQHRDQQPRDRSPQRAAQPSSTRLDAMSRAASTDRDRSARQRGTQGRSSSRSTHTSGSSSSSVSSSSASGSRAPKREAPKSEGRLRPETALTHFRTSIDPRTEADRRSVAGIEICREYNSSRGCSRNDRCKFYHLCTACVATDKPAQACFHPEPDCPARHH
jgi:hypothetical protein